MLGVIIGDILGSRRGISPYFWGRSKFFHEGSSTTGTSIMTIAVAKAIMTCKGKWGQLGKHAAEQMQNLGHKYAASGFCDESKKLLLVDTLKPRNDYSIDAVASIVPCGLIARTEAEAKLLAGKVIKKTNKHIEALKDANTIAFAIFLAWNGASRSEIKERMRQDYFENFDLEYYLHETLGDTILLKEEDYKDIVPLALLAVINSNSFEDAISNAINVRGHADGLAAIAGGFAEAYYGIPSKIKREAFTFLDGELLGIYKEWEKLSRHSSTIRKHSLITKYIGKLGNSTIADEFQDEFLSFLETNVETNAYSNILEKNNLKWETASMQSADIDSFDDQCMLALIAGVIDTDNYTDGVFDEFVQGGYIDKWLQRLKTVDEELAAEATIYYPIGVKINLHSSQNAFVSELSITEKLIAIKNKSADGGIFTHQYEFAASIEHGKNCLVAMEKCLESAGWQDQKSIGEISTEAYFYQLEAEYDDGKIIMRKGTFDRVHIPEKLFKQFIDYIYNVLCEYGFGDLVSLDGFMSAIRPGEVKYCGVEYSEGGRIYHYRTTDLQIQVGDRVFVPVGEDNSKRVATVKTLEFVRWDATPYPLEKTKEIIAMADSKTGRPKALRQIRQVPYLNFSGDEITFDI